MDARVLERVVKKERERLEREKGWKGPGGHSAGSSIRSDANGNNVLSVHRCRALSFFFPNPDSSHPDSPLSFARIYFPLLLFRLFGHQPSDERTKRNESEYTCI